MSKEKCMMYLLPCLYCVDKIDQSFREAENINRALSFLNHSGSFVYLIVYESWSEY